MYNDKVMDHFNNPRNVGESAQKDGVGQVQSPSCGDTTYIYLEVADGIIKDIKFKTFGCAAAIASSSVLTEMAKGMTLEQAKQITTPQIVEQLGGLPEYKVHCSVLAADALRAAILDYESKKGNN
ncbi:MAG: iron-sulfur cluster assembly scaffold protein [Clostridiales bacterium]|nr:iron-sulfur cluster assembly scaffold protein [Clostridiales bacterium]